MKSSLERKMPRSLKPLKRCCFGIGLVLAACNVFNPSGEGDAGTSVAAQLTDGENFFRDQNYAAAMESFAKAIEQDSGNSMAYYGYAKSAMRKYKVNASTLLTEVSKAQEGTGVPFIGADNETITNYLQATSKARKALNSLTLRDTLTRWYNYTLDSTSTAAKKDPLRATRVAALKAYWAKAELAGAKGYYRKSQFPLSDLKMGYDKVIADFGFIELIYAVTHLRDLNGDDSITDKDNLLKSLNFTMGAGGLKVENLEGIADSLKNDTAGQRQLNSLIQNVSSGLGSASKVLELLGPAITGKTPGDSTGADAGLTEQVSQNMDSVITSLGNAVTFYQFGDGKDNDGDGCSDEEILDGKDNDGDGFTDEDARILSDDLVDNDHNGLKNDPVTKLDPDEGLNSSFILGFVAKSSFVKGAMYMDKATRIATQADSLDTKSSAELKGFYKTNLDAAKKNIGGCWNNY
jgi:tetratricopeptide (TPR) repeat protein